MLNLLCLGFGYSAQHYVADFGAAYAGVIGTTRQVEAAADRSASAAPGCTVTPLAFDGASVSPELIAAAHQADRVLLSIPPGPAGDPALAALGNVFAGAARLQSIVYLSTVGVYGDRQGGAADETTPPSPLTARSHARLAAEQGWSALGLRLGKPVAILRLAGIYGPGRNVLVKLCAGRATPVVKPGQVFNRIHVADVAQAINAAFSRRAGAVFNVADDEPAPAEDVIAFAARLLGIAPPAAIPIAAAAGALSRIALSFYGENKRVRNASLKQELGVQLHYPTYREGLRGLYASGAEPETSIE